MTTPDSLSAVYKAIDQLMNELSTTEYFQLAATLEHRMHKVAWTSSSDLLEELRNVLQKELDQSVSSMPTSLTQELKKALQVIDRAESM